jgi:endoglucanase
MNKNDIGQMLKALVESDGPSGREGNVAARVRELAAGLADEVRQDTLGNLIAIKQGRGESAGRVMIAAHMDEIGLVVTRVEGGFLHIGRIGGVDPRTYLGQEVTVYPSGPGAEMHPDGLRGFIGERPPHVRGSHANGGPTPLGELRIDLGLSPERLAQGPIRVGDPVVVSGPHLELLEGRVVSKALDNRASVAAMLGALGYAGVMQHTWDIAAVATVQEEVGLRGAITGAYGVAPDLAITIDVTFGDTPGLDESKTVRMDKGPAIGWGPNLHPGVVKRLRETAEALEIPFVTEPLEGPSGTDAWAIQVAREGIPTGLVSIPIRYMHSPTEMVALADIDRAARLLAAFIARLDGDIAAALAEEV